MVNSSSGSRAKVTGRPALLLAIGVLAAAPCTASQPDLYRELAPAVESIVASSVNPYGPGDQVSGVVGSGFIVDASGLIVTNCHLVSAGRSSP